MNMFKKTKAKTVRDYLDAVPEGRQETVRALHAFIQKAAPKLKPHFSYNMIGYGAFKYRNYKNEIIDWPVVALANQKQYVSVYVCAIVDGKYVAEKHKKELGPKVKVGKSCISFKKLEDINLPVLGKVLKKAAKKPGLAHATANR
ncbi:MAG: iron chaperone [Planctomycetota bacterium]